MEFVEFRDLLQKQVGKMTEGQRHLFVTDVDKDAMWELYLDSFPEGTNEIFRERREFDCGCCRNFIKSFGHVVSIRDGMMTSIWDFDVEGTIYQPVVEAMRDYVKSKPVKNVLVSSQRKFGTKQSHEEINGEVVTWYHFHAEVPKESIVLPGAESVGALQGQFRDTKNVLKRSLEEISDEAVSTVLELIAQNSLYKGQEWKASLSKLENLKKEYKSIPEGKKDIYVWERSLQVGIAVARIRNHSIGVLLTDISDDVELDDAVRRYESIVAPSNYKRPKAIFTKKMVEQAQKKVEELGYSDSLGRRHATIDDITINNILFADHDSTGKLGGNVFDDLKKEVPVNPKKFGKVEEVSMDTFIKDILPKASSVELLLENRHAPNMVSLIAPKSRDSKTMFKWNNSFGWAYSGNITDSMKERVKAAGGDVNGVLRFSLQWNTKGDTEDDLDAHCIEPGGNEICFENLSNFRTTGKLDVDIITPYGKPAVENITWTDARKMREGVYRFFVRNFTDRGGLSGFEAEIEFEGQIFSFEYPRPLKNKEDIEVAKVKYSHEHGFEVISSLDASVSSKDIWGLKSNQFHPVSVCMFSPNYWDEQSGIGHKHFFFMLKGCRNSETPNGFFNEFLKENLMEHKRVFESLGSKMRVEDSEQQLSGVGFSSTKRNSFICRVEGSFSRTLKVTT